MNTIMSILVPKGGSWKGREGSWLAQRRWLAEGGLYSMELESFKEAIT